MIKEIVQSFFYEIVENLLLFIPIILQCNSTGALKNDYRRCRRRTTEKIPIKTHGVCQALVVHGSNLINSSFGSNIYIQFYSSVTFGDDASQSIVPVKIDPPEGGGWRTSSAPRMLIFKNRIFIGMRSP